MFDTSTLKGHPVLLDLWATWCGPHLLEMPLIDRIYKSTKDAGLTVLGLDQDEHPGDALDYLKRKNYGRRHGHLHHEDALRDLARHLFVHCLKPENPRFRKLRLQLCLGRIKLAGSSLTFASSQAKPFGSSAHVI